MSRTAARCRYFRNSRINGRARCWRKPDGPDSTSPTSAGWPGNIRLPGLWRGSRVPLAYVVRTTTANWRSAASMRRPSRAICGRLCPKAGGRFLKASAAAWARRQQAPQSVSSFVNYVDRTLLTHGCEIGDLQGHAIGRAGLDLGGITIHVNDHEILHTGDLFRDSGRRKVYIVEWRTSTARNEIVHPVFQIMLIVVVVTEEGRGDTISLEQRFQGGHIRIVALPAFDCCHWWMMGENETERGLPGALEVVFQPQGLFPPKVGTLRFRGGGVLDIAVNYREMGASPIEGVIGLHAEKIEIIGGVPLMIAQGRKNRSIAEQLAFCIEENRPERRVIAVRHQIPGVHDEIGLGVCQNRGNHPTMDLVTRARIAIDDKLKACIAGRRRFE